jgi:hypothetical protein
VEIQKTLNEHLKTFGSIFDKLKTIEKAVNPNSHVESKSYVPIKAKGDLQEILNELSSFEAKLKVTINKVALLSDLMLQKEKKSPRITKRYFGYQ